MRKYKLHMEQQRMLEEVLQYMESVSEVDEGLLFTHKHSLSVSDWNCLLWKFILSGVDFAFNKVSRTFLIPKEYFIKETLQKLKTIFQTSHSEIGESIRFLVCEGVSFEHIQRETGVSRATIYRYTKGKD